jgi:hypothetical protein
VAPRGRSLPGSTGLKVTVTSKLYSLPQLSTVAGEPASSRVDPFSFTSCTRCIWRIRTMIRATSDWSGVQPAKLAVGETGPTLVVVVVAAGASPGVPATEASAECSQLPDGMISETSRITRSQSNRVAATVATDCSRVWAIWAKSV